MLEDCNEYDVIENKLFCSSSLFMIDQM